MNEQNIVSSQLKSREATSRSVWIARIVRWSVGIYWYGLLALTAVAFIFFVVVSTMTKQCFPFPFSVPVTITFPAMDSLNAEASQVDEAESSSKKGSIREALKAELNDGLDEIEGMAFKAFSINGDLMFAVPMRKLWPFLMVGFFTPLTIALAIAFQLRKILKSLSLDKPFDPVNIRRVKVIGWLVVVLGPLESIVEYLGAKTLLPQVADIGFKMESAFHFGYQSILFGILILALVHIFEAGAKMQRDQELTI